MRSRDVFTHCPFGTTALPGPTYGGWSNWVDTGARRNEVNTCKPTAARCSDGSLQVVAWHSADGQDVPPPSGSSGISYWYPDAVVRLTAAEKAKLDWAINNVPIQRVETPAPMMQLMRAKKCVQPLFGVFGAGQFPNHHACDAIPRDGERIVV